ncbi:MAG: hypothetical protein K2P46_02035 [Alistipes sp.]|nr:hypothetical protein [Alistipes sp.]
MLYTSATGYRTRDEGVLTETGTLGYAWCSSPHASGSVSPGGLNFNSDNVNPLNGFSGRALGFPVRCVQHLRLLFAVFHARRTRRQRIEYVRSSRTRSFSRPPTSRSTSAWNRGEWSW